MELSKKEYLIIVSSIMIALSELGETEHLEMIEQTILQDGFGEILVKMTEDEFGGDKDQTTAKMTILCCKILEAIKEGKV